MACSSLALHSKAHWWSSEFDKVEIVIMGKVEAKLLVMPMAIAAAFATQSASADTLSYLGPAYGFVSTTGVVTSPAAVTSSPVAGGFLMQNTSVPSDSFLAWCLDVQGWLTSPATYSLRTGTDFFYTEAGNVKIGALERLATAVLPYVNTKMESGAFQLAVWEIVNETAGQYGFDSGNFTVVSATDGAYDLAGQWLTKLNKGTFSADTMTLSVWKDVNDRTQDLAVFTIRVPEPDIYALMGMGLGLLAWSRRRYKLKDAATA
jgi:hypothetical protein